MNPSSKNLALRDPALAALMGAIDGSDFGSDDDESFGMGHYGFEFGGFEFGDDYGAEPDHRQFKRPQGGGGAMVPAPQVAAALWAKHVKQTAHTENRQRLIEPNRGSATKVERYQFSVNQALVLGVAAALSASGQPDTNIRPQRVTMNAPAPGFATISEIKVANVSVTVGGTADAFDFGANGVGQSLDMPTLSPANRATVLGNYTGFVPPGYVGGAAYLFCASFKGPATIVA